MKYIKVLLVLIVMSISNIDAKKNGEGNIQPNSLKTLADQCDTTDLEISIKSDDNWKQSDQQKLVNLTLKNETQNQIIIKEVGNESETNYIVEVKNSKGGIVSFSDEGKSLTKHRRNEFSVTYVKVKTGEEVKRVINLAKLYKLINGQTYSITVKKSVYVEVGKCYQTIASNTIEVEI